MPVRYERDDARRRVVVTIQGPFALPAFLGVIERQRVDHPWGYGIRYDLRGMTGQPLPQTFVNPLAWPPSSTSRGVASRP